jgi:hypothetical protein
MHVTNRQPVRQPLRSVDEFVQIATANDGLSLDR